MIHQKNCIEAENAKSNSSQTNQEIQSKKRYPSPKWSDQSNRPSRSRSYSSFSKISCKNDLHKRKFKSQLLERSQQIHCSTDHRDEVICFCHLANVNFTHLHLAWELISELTILKKSFSMGNFERKACNVVPKFMPCLLAY